MAKICVSIILGCFVLISQVTVFAAPRQQSREQLDTALRELWSRSDLTSRGAKNKLQALGTDAIQPLVALLEEFVVLPLSTYEARRERQKARYLESNNEGAYGNTTEEESSVQRTVASRVGADAIDLAGALHAAEAVPVLIRLMQEELEIARLGREIVYPEMMALAQIGPAASPALVRSIREADAIVNSTELYGSKLSPRQRLRADDHFRHLIQKRALIVLAKIGDARMLPFLQEMRRTTTDDFLIPYIDEAIENTNH